MPSCAGPSSVCTETSPTAPTVSMLNGVDHGVVDERITMRLAIGSYLEKEKSCTVAAPRARDEPLPYESHVTAE